MSDDVLQFCRRDPGVAYLDADLWLPLSEVPVRGIQQRLTFTMFSGRKRDIPTDIEIFSMAKHHIQVPRNLFTLKYVRHAYGIEIVDLRPSSYPSTTILHSIIPRDNQTEPLRLMEELGDGTLNLACGLGKTVVALYHAVRLGVPTLVICNNTTILAGWEREIIGKLDFEGKVGWVKQNKFPEDTPICLATVQTLASKADVLPRSFLRRWGLVIFDEGHHMSANWFCTVANLFPGKRLALTATTTRNDGLEKVYQYHLGKVFYSDLSQDLEPEIEFVHLHGLRPAREYSEDVALKNWIARNAEFNQVITEEVKTLLQEGRSILALSHRVEQLELLHPTLPGSGLIHGVIKDSAREEALSEANPILATMQLAQEGLDKPSLDTLLCLTLFSNENAFQQCVGRILRTYEDKKHPRALFFVPDVRRCQKQAARIRRFAKMRGYKIKETRR